MTDFVFPEDVGTGAEGGDNADAANFAAHRHTKQLTDFVEVGLDLTVDWANEVFTLGSGMVFVSDDSAQEAQTSEVRDEGVSYVVIVDERTDVSFSGDSKVFIDVDLSSDDTVSVVVQDSAPASPSLQVGMLDATNQNAFRVNTVADQNREFTSLKGGIDSDRRFTIPDGYTSLVPEEYDIQGEVEPEGTGQLVPVSDSPTPKRHDHRGTNLIPRLSSVKSVFEKWDTPVYIPEERAHTVADELVVNGTVEVDGGLMCVNSLSVDTLEVGENGSVSIL